LTIKKTLRTKNTFTVGKKNAVLTTNVCWVLCLCFFWVRSLTLAALREDEDDDDCNYKHTRTRRHIVHTTHSACDATISRRRSFQRTAMGAQLWEERGGPGGGPCGGDVADRSSIHHGPPRTGSRRAATSYRLIAHPRCSLILTTGKSVPRPVCPYLIMSERGRGHGDIPNQVF
jgi:hypothetical protein